jgi:hypothetical protein
MSAQIYLQAQSNVNAVHYVVVRCDLLFHVYQDSDVQKDTGNRLAAWNPDIRCAQRENIRRAFSHSVYRLRPFLPPTPSVLTRQAASMHLRLRWIPTSARPFEVVPRLYYRQVHLCYPLRRGSCGERRGYTLTTSVRRLKVFSAVSIHNMRHPTLSLFQEF